MNKTKISVIMPSLNVSKYIKQCLQEEIDFVKASFNLIAECKGKVFCLPFTRDFDKSMLDRVLDLSEERNMYDLNHIWKGENDKR